MEDKAFSNKKSDKNINDGRVIDLSQYKRVNKQTYIRVYSY